MSSSWGHQLLALAEPSVERQESAWCHGGCSRCKRGSRSVAEFRAVLRYVTGRGGRSTERRTDLCRQHAAAFAAKHGIQVPELPARGQGGAS